jgi:hypothetical protein
VPSQTLHAGTEAENDPLGPIDVWLADEPHAATDHLIVVDYLAADDRELLRPLLEANLGEPSATKRWGDFSDEERARVTAVAGGATGHLLPRLTRPARALALVRDPVNTALAAGARDFPHKDPGQVIGAFASLVREWPERYSNPQSRVLLAGRYDVADLPVANEPADEAELWRMRLTELYELYEFLVLDRLPRSVGRVAELLGWRSVNVRALRVGRVDVSRLRKTVYPYNQFDLALYSHALDSLGSRRRRGRLHYRAQLRRDQIAGAAMWTDSLAVDLYFARKPLPAKAGVHVFQHIRKTGGTAFRALLYEALLEADFEPRFIPRRTDDLALSYQRLHDELTQDERSRLLWAASHSANYLNLLLERPVRPVTIVREPLDRTISRYFFAGGPEKREGRRVDRLAEVFVEGRRPDYANGQSRSLLEPYFDVRELPVTQGPPDDADLWRERLFGLVETYVVLVQDELGASLELFGADWRLGSHALPRLRVNRDRPGIDEVDEETRELVYAFNWLDRELYAHAAARLAQEKAKAKKLTRRVLRLVRR